MAMADTVVENAGCFTATHCWWKFQLAPHGASWPWRSIGHHPFQQVFWRHLPGGFGLKVRAGNEAMDNSRIQNNDLKQVCWNRASHPKSHGCQTLSKSQRPSIGPCDSRTAAPRPSGRLVRSDLGPFGWPAKLRRGYTQKMVVWYGE